jgi:hypothetical protein
MVHVGGTLWNDLAPGTVDRLIGGRDMLSRRLDAAGTVAVAVPTGSMVLQRYEATVGDGDRVRLILAPGSPTHALEFTRAEWELLQTMRRSSNESAPSVLSSGAAMSRMQRPEEARLTARLLRAGLVDIPDVPWTSD